MKNLIKNISLMTILLSLSLPCDAVVGLASKNIKILWKKYSTDYTHHTQKVIQYFSNM
jgi:hypothetical protein